MLFVGAILVSSWVLAPRVSDAEQTAPRPEPTDPLVGTVATMNAEVDRLRDRLGPLPTYPPPTRDPFSFAPVADAPRPVVTPERVSVPPPVDLPATPVLPQLIAIIADPATAGSADAYRAAIGDGDDVAIVSVGESRGGLVVHEVLADAIVFRDRATSATFRVTLH